MIYSDKQYNVTKNELTKLREALAETRARDADEEWLKDIEASALESQIVSLEAEIAHYHLIKAGQVAVAKAHSLKDLPSILVAARIASGLSQSDLARKVGVKPQQIQRYEASEYMGASLDRLIEIAGELNVHITGLFENERASAGSIFSWDGLDDIVWKQFPAREMVRRGWFDLPRGADLFECVRNYFVEGVGPQIASSYHRKKMYGDSVPNEYALLAWQARIIERANLIIEAHKPPEFVLDDQWLPELVALTRRPDGPSRARRLLLRKGIVLVIEKHLGGTYLDGGAMLDREGRPVIGLTLRYDRLDNFWFVLFHELGHIFLHLFNGLRFDFFDEEGSSADDEIERQADEFALNALIPEEKWNQCLSRFARSVEAVEIDARNLGIDPSIVAGRIRKELGDYTILNDLIGQGKVASQFEGDDYELA